MQEKRSRESLIITITFAVTLCAFSIGTWITKNTYADHRAARELAEFVAHIYTSANSKGLQELLKRLDKYCEEHVLCREEILAARGIICYKLFACSGKPRFIVGHRGWLFYTALDEAKDQYKGGFHYAEIQPGPLTDNELSAWNRTFESRRAWLAKRGIKYLVAIVPDKETIYPENYPAAYAESKSMNYIGQLKDYMAKHSRVDFVDLRPALTAGKPYASIYYARDSHWTKAGAFLAYLEIMNHLKAADSNMTLQPVTLANYNLEHAYRRRLDIAGGIGLSDVVTDDTVHYVLKNEMPLRQLPLPVNLSGQSDHEKSHSMVTESKGRRGPRLVFLSDSFGRWIQPFFYRTFSRVAVQWSYLFPPSLIEKEKPDVVIQEVAERNLKGAAPYNPSELEER